MNKFQIIKKYRKDFRSHISNENFQPIEQSIIWISDLVAFSYNLQSNGPFKFKYAIDRQLNPNKYTAFYLQASLKLKNYQMSNQLNEDQLFIVSTDTNIIPEYNPIADCNDIECYGNLV